MPAVHAGAVEDDACYGVIERVAIKGNVVPGQILVFPFHPEGVDKRDAAGHADEVVPGCKPLFAHELFDGGAVLRDGSSIDPIVDIDKPIRDIGFESLNFRITIIRESLFLLIRRNDNVFVHQLIEQKPPPLSMQFYTPLYGMASAPFFELYQQRLRIHTCYNAAIRDENTVPVG